MEKNQSFWSFFSKNNDSFQLFMFYVQIIILYGLLIGVSLWSFNQEGYKRWLSYGVIYYGVFFELPRLLFQITLSISKGWRMREQ